MKVLAKIFAHKILSGKRLSSRSQSLAISIPETSSSSQETDFFEVKNPEQMNTDMMMALYAAVFFLETEGSIR